VPIKSKHKSVFATPVGLGFGFIGAPGLIGPYGSLWPIKWVILAKAFLADQSLEYAHLQSFLGMAFAPGTLNLYDKE
jgi:hypothetical protein